MRKETKYIFIVLAFVFVYLSVKKKRLFAQAADVVQPVGPSLPGTVVRPILPTYGGESKVVKGVERDPLTGAPISQIKKYGLMR